jgi:formate dehydrogenase major subunit/NADH-quinone oxidoreductase subunit G
MEEIGQLVPLYGPVDYKALGTEGLILGTAQGQYKKARFIPVNGKGKVPHAGDAYPLVLLTGSVLFHSGSLSTHSPELSQIGPGGWVALGPEDARRYQLDDGQSVVVRSPRGEIKAQVKINRQQTRGTVFIPYHFAEQSVNTLTSKDLEPTYVTLQKA